MTLAFNSSWTWIMVDSWPFQVLQLALLQVYLAINQYSPAQSQLCWAWPRSATGCFICFQPFQTMPITLFYSLLYKDCFATRHPHEIGIPFSLATKVTSSATFIDFLFDRVQSLAICIDNQYWEITRRGYTLQRRSENNRNKLGLSWAKLSLSWG